MHIHPQLQLYLYILYVHLLYSRVCIDYPFISTRDCCTILIIISFAPYILPACKYQNRKPNKAQTLFCSAQLCLWISSPDATVGHKGVLTKALVMPLIFPLSLSLSPFFPPLSPLFSPQALQPHTEKAGRAQGAGQRAELAVYSRQNTGGWVNLMCAAGSLAEHLTAECVSACRFSLHFSLSLSRSPLCASLNTITTSRWR